MHSSPAALPRRRVLFVDDEPLVLGGLRRSLRHLRDAFDLVFAGSGAEALELLGRESFDVVVSDMHMPGMSGADLLSEVQRLYPATARIILSGHSDQSRLMGCIGCAHRFLPKPCEASELQAVLRQVAAIQASFNDDIFMRMVVSMKRIPAVPELYLRIAEAVQRPECELDDIGALIEQDPGTTAGLLRIVNSAYFGLARRILDAREAVHFLGVEMVKALVLACSAFRHFEANPHVAGEIAAIWRHSMDVAVRAREIARQEHATPRVQNECFVAGLLHDVGKLILAENFGDLWQRAETIATQQRLTLHESETRVFGLTHADVAGGILGLWGLPSGVVDAV